MVNVLTTMNWPTEDDDTFAARIVAGVFDPDPDFGTPTTTTAHRLLSEELAAEIADRARDVGLV